MALSIQIEDQGFLDLFGDVKIPVTFAVSDIGQLGSSQGANSTSFEIPITRGNEEKLDYVSKLTYNSSARNKNVQCSLWQNTTLVKKGFLIITGIGKTITANFFGDNVEWFQKIDGKKLVDVIFPGSYNHIWNETNIIEGAGRREGYFYHLHSPNFDQTTQSGNELITLLDKSRPSTFLHSIMTYIFLNQGIKLEGDLLRDPFYSKIVLPFNKKEFRLNSRSAKAKQGTVYLYSGEKQSIFSPNPGNINPMVMDWGDSDNPDGSPTVYTLSNWDNTTKTYTAPFTDTYNVSLKIENDFSLHNSYDLYYRVKVNGISVLTQSAVPNDTFPVNNCTFFTRRKFTEDSSLGSDRSPNFKLELNQGDQVVFEVAHSYDNSLGDRDVTCQYCTGSSLLDPPTLDCSNTNTVTLTRCQVDTPFTASTLEITPSRGDYEGGDEGSDYVLGNGIDLASTLPNITQTDLVKYVFNAFGIIPQFDVYTQTLHLNKFENLRSKKNVAENWTDKIDYINTPHITHKAVGGYGKKTFFKYEKDNDDSTLKGYTQSVGEAYGTGSIDINNDFLEEEKTVYTAPFSAARVNSSSNIVLKQDDNPKIAFLSGTTRPNVKINNVPFAAYDLRFDTTQGGSTPSTKSLGFGMPEGVTSADTSLLKTYYALKSSMLNKQVLLKVYLRLDETDIINLDYSIPKVLNINGETLYYVLNKVSQYMGDGSSTECELLLME